MLDQPWDLMKPPHATHHRSVAPATEGDADLGQVLEAACVILHPPSNATLAVQVGPWVAGAEPGPPRLLRCSPVSINIVGLVCAHDVLAGISNVAQISTLILRVGDGGAGPEAGLVAAGWVRSPFDLAS